MSNFLRFFFAFALSILLITALEGRYLDLFPSPSSSSQQPSHSIHPTIILLLLRIPSAPGYALLSEMPVEIACESVCRHSLPMYLKSFRTFSVRPSLFSLSLSSLFFSSFQSNLIAQISVNLMIIVAVTAKSRPAG